jgi:hypothetical protein
MKQQINVLNAFSLNMVDFDGSARWHRVSREVLRDMLDDGHSIAPYLKSYIGHADTAAVISADLGFCLPTNRETVKLEAGSRCLVCQYKGPRLAEGTSTLPEGATIEYYWLTVSP